MMTVTFDDIHREVGLKNAGYEFGPCDFWELMYADDAMIISNRAR